MAGYPKGVFMKYEAGDILYYVNPFVFIIEKVQVEFAYKEEDGTLYYIDCTGAYLREEELFDNLKEAQKDALNRLDKFSCECRYRILNERPQFGEELL